MTNENFKTIVRETLIECEKTLTEKGKDYSNKDRLHQFKVAGELQLITPKQALFGMFAKHIVSVADMCRKDEDYSLEQWQEKIGDSINYLLMLKAIVCEEKENETQIQS